MRAPLACKAAIVALLALVCGSCSFERSVKAVFIGDRLAFIVDQEPPDGPPWCLSQFAVIDQQRGTVWQIDGLLDLETEKCVGGFPLFYGRAPEGAKESVAAGALSQRNLYVISGWGRNPYVGAFVLFREGRRLRVENLDPHSPAATAVRDGKGADRYEPPAAEAG